MITAKYVISGVIMFVLESPILYANWQSSGLYPSNINIGTNTGARMFHFADAEPIKRFINAENNTKIIINGINPIFAFSKKLAPVNAMIVPNFV